MLNVQLCTLLFVYVKINSISYAYYVRRSRKFKTESCGSATRTGGRRWQRRTATSAMSGCCSTARRLSTPSYRRGSMRGTRTSGACSAPASTSPSTRPRATNMCTESAVGPAAPCTRIALATYVTGKQNYDAVCNSVLEEVIA